ncbi:MAG: sigma 54-interacting transcriptional regulator, partial [Acidobacteriota bacterium]
VEQTILRYGNQGLLPLHMSRKMTENSVLFAQAGGLAAADGGTFLLVEIGELDPRNQVKLLRVLQDRTYEAVGSSVTRRLDVRVISATNRDLHQAVNDGMFREDLLYRINLITLHLPSLSQRKHDIPLLARHFLTRATTAFGRSEGPSEIAPEALAWLEAQHWPGNVRQLEQFLARSVLVADSSKLDLAVCERLAAMDAAETDRDQLPPVGRMTMEEVEKAMIEKSLRHHGGNISKAAESLGLSRAPLYRRLEKHRITPRRCVSSSWPTSSRCMSSSHRAPYGSCATGASG